MNYDETRHRLARLEEAIIDIVNELGHRADTAGIAERLKRESVAVRGIASSVKARAAENFRNGGIPV